MVDPVKTPVNKGKAKHPCKSTKYNGSRGALHQIIRSLPTMAPGGGGGADGSPSQEGFSPVQCNGGGGARSCRGRVNTARAIAAAAEARDGEGVDREVT
ncbi:hypothetical protein E2562_029182 [Oryza meyeriana var. granulata]|uniref:Uncharacterized protein n=1 Tax=Oryza meyeriana var. granulata TaxID=110450 RepID=A0A6G1C271_9ORYZ|nr:hypothetical protein E2562_029182 [Oryza meyeriana var. granulata]